MELRITAFFKVRLCKY